MAERTTGNRSGAQPPVDLAGLVGSWSWSRLDEPEVRSAFEAAVLKRIAIRRWFGAKARTLEAVRLVDRCLLTDDLCVALVEIRFADGLPDLYQLPLAIAALDKLPSEIDSHAAHDWARFRFDSPPQEYVVYDALVSAAECRSFLDAFQSVGLRSEQGVAIAIVRGPDHKALVEAPRDELEPHLSAAEQSNTSVRYGERLILKLYRRIEPGINPDWEINGRLSAAAYGAIPPLIGAIEYRQSAAPPWTLALLQGYVPNFGDGWSYMLERLASLLDGVQPDDERLVSAAEHDFIAASLADIPLDLQKRFGDTLADARVLGERTAEMHQALASSADGAFRPEPLTAERRAMTLERKTVLTHDTLEQLSRSRSRLGPEVAAAADILLRSRRQLEFMQRQAAEIPIHAMAIRIHGDFHLGQILMTERGPVIIDFEGEPARPLEERREKQLALRDVAGMIRSLHYASRAAAAKIDTSQGPDAARVVEFFSRAWYHWASASFLAGYRRSARGMVFVPDDEDELRALIQACILDKAIYELRYELNHRPDWVQLPLGALVDVVAGSGLG